MKQFKNSMTYKVRQYMKKNPTASFKQVSEECGTTLQTVYNVRHKARKTFNLHNQRMKQSPAMNALKKLKGLKEKPIKTEPIQTEIFNKLEVEFQQELLAPLKIKLNGHYKISELRQIIAHMQALDALVK
jgi:hypothetical protein